MKLTGSLCALITPFTREGSLDMAAFRALIDFHLEAGTHGLIVAGSTGEAAMLDDGEFIQLLDAAVERVAGRIPVLAGTGAAGTHKTLRQTHVARDHGVDAALVVTPYYVRPTQDGLYRHFMTIADEGGLPVVLYNVPGRTACDMAPATVARLKTHPGIVAIKEALADPARMAELLAMQSSDFAVLSGDDPTACAAMLAGAAGVISVAANVVPGRFAQLCDHARAGRRDQAESADAALRPLYEMLGAEPNPIPAKWFMHLLGLCNPDLRLPLLPLSSGLHERAKAVLETLLVNAGSKLH